MSKIGEVAAGLVRKDDHATSVKAAKVITPKVSTLMRQVHAVMLMANHGLTDSEMRRFMLDRGYPDRPESTYRKRRTDLVRLGYVADTGMTRVNAQGSKEKVWRITDKKMERA